MKRRALGGRKNRYDDELLWMRPGHRQKAARRRMTRRGRATLLMPLVGFALLAVALAPRERGLDSLRELLAPPDALRLAPVSAAPGLPAAPVGLAGRLPASRTAFEAALASADWLPADPEPGTPLWETLTPAAGGALRVEYSLDVALSRSLHRVLERGRVALGHVVVMDPSRHELLAFASTDPERFPPTRDYPAASLIKVVTAAAALDREPRAEAHGCRYAGNPWRLRRSHLDPPRSGKDVSLRKALATSNNQCFARLAVHKIGAAGMLDGIRRFGFLEPAGPAHGPGRAEDPGDDAFALGRLGCGLDGCRITPLHAARLAGTLVDGTLAHPRWVRRVVDASGRDLALPEPPAPREALTPGLAAELRGMLVDTTTRGTARRAFRDSRGRPLLGSLRVAGKTGSLSGRDPDGRYEWFMGVAPAERPRFAVAVLLVQNELWWRNASQIAAETFQVIFCQGRDCAPQHAERWRVPERAERPEG